MDDSDSELLSDSEEIDIVAQANKARAAAAAKQAENPAPEEKKEEEEVAAADDDEDAAAEAAAAAAAEEAAKQEEAARLAAEEEAARKAAEEEAVRKAAEEETARKAAEEEAARKAAEEEAARKAAEEEAARKAEEEAARKAEEEAARKAEEAARLEAIRQKEEEERRKKEEEEQQALAETEEDEEEEEEIEEEEVEAEEEVQAKPEPPQPRSRATSTYHEQHLFKLREQEERDRLARLEAKQAHSQYSSMANVFKSDAQKWEEEEKLRIQEENRKKAALKADVKNEVIDGERRITELRNAQKKGKKKKAWKPLKHGFVHIINSSFKMKKGKKHKINKEDGYYLCLQLLPISCNIDETEAEWTKNKKNDNLVPALVAFSTKEIYDDFAKTVKGKNMKAASGLMPLAKFATGLCHLRDLYAMGPDIATAIANLKMNHIKSEAVLPVDSYRGGDSGEDLQLVIVDRSQAFILVMEEESALEEWKQILKENQPAE